MEDDNVSIKSFDENFSMRSSDNFEDIFEKEVHFET